MSQLICICVPVSKFVLFHKSKTTSSEHQNFFFIANWIVLSFPSVFSSAKFQNAHKHTDMETANERFLDGLLLKGLASPNGIRGRGFPWHVKCLQSSLHPVSKPFKTQWDCLGTCEVCLWFRKKTVWKHRNKKCLIHILERQVGVMNLKVAETTYDISRRQRRWCKPRLSTVF